MNHRAHSLLSTTCLTLALAYVFPCAVLALPEGGVVSAGVATITSSNAKLDIVQESDKAIIDWRGFDIGKGEHTEFHQPHAASVAINRVNSASPSHIDGKLTANGNVVIINQNGVLFGKDARVDVNGLVATTANSNNQTLMRDGILAFDKPGNPDASIINEGQITAKEAGLVGLVAPNVVNAGTITAKLGRVQLASGDSAAVDLYGDGLMKIAVSDEVTSQLVMNTGSIKAEGGTIALTAAAGGKIVNSLIGVQGELQAQTVGMKDGEIIISAAGSNAVENNVAAHKGTKQGASAVLVSAVLDASGRDAGEKGGKVSVLGDEIALMGGTVIDVSGDSGKSDTTLGKTVSAQRMGAAGGEVKIGGDYLGKGSTPTAKNLYVDKNAYVFADALTTGDAGRSIFWSDGTTQFDGNVFARALGGQPIDPNTGYAMASVNATGNGGFVETSGHEQLQVGGYVDLTASNGEKGTYFLDPTNITIYGNVNPAFQSTDGTINLGANLKLWLDASDVNNVNLTYSTDALSGATVTGVSGANTITTSTNVSSQLAVGARIRLGTAGAVTTANTLGSDTYTITGIAGTTLTLGSPLTTDYNGGAGNNTLYRGLVTQLSDKSGQANHAVQATPARMPLYISNNMNGLSTIRTLTSNPDYLDTGSLGILSNSDLSIYTVNRVNNYTNGGALDGAGSYLFDRISASFNIFSLKAIGNKYTLQIRYDDNSGLRVVSSVTNISNNPTLIGLFRKYGVNDSIAINGVTQASIADATKPLTPPNLRIGGHETATVSTDANYSEILYYQNSMNSNDNTLINQYQSAKWGVGLDPLAGAGTEVAEATAHNAALPNDAATNGYSVFSTRYLERLSQSADISLQASNNITLDLKTDTLNFATAGRSLSLSAGNQITTASAGNITTNNGAINLTGVNGIILNHTLELNSGNGAITFNNPVTLGVDTTINAGSGTMTFGNTVNGTRNLTATAGTFSFAQPLGGVTPLGNVSLTSTNSLTLPSINASSILARVTGATADIIIPTGKTLTATGAGNALALATNNNFINNAGAGAFSTPSGRWLVFSTNAAQDTIGGLSPTALEYSKTYANIATVGAGNRLIYSVSAPSVGGGSAPVVAVPLPATSTSITSPLPVTAPTSITPIITPPLVQPAVTPPLPLPPTTDIAIPNTVVIVSQLGKMVQPPSMTMQKEYSSGTDALAPYLSPSEGQPSNASSDTPDNTSNVDILGATQPDSTKGFQTIMQGLLKIHPVLQKRFRLQDTL